MCRLVKVERCWVLLSKWGSGEKFFRIPLCAIRMTRLNLKGFRPFQVGAVRPN
jgi:hypothetical protein